MFQYPCGKRLEVDRKVESPRYVSIYCIVFLLFIAYCLSSELDGGKSEEWVVL